MWPVYVLNMAKDTVRMDRCRSVLDGQGIRFERFEAVVGRDLNDAEIDTHYDHAANQARFRYALLPGEFGCYFSHLALWKMIAQSKVEGAIILEDDFAAAPDLADVLKALCHNTGNWDMAKLYARRPDKKMLSPVELCDGYRLATPYQIPNTTLGYVIRRDAARRLLQSQSRFFRPVDEDLRHFWEHGLNISLVLPPPLAQGEQSQIGDTIEAARKAGRASSKLVQAWKNIRYRLGFLFKQTFYRTFGR